jgi:integrase
VPYEWEYRQHKLWRRTGRGGGKYYALWNDERGRLQKRSLDTADAATAKDRLVDFALRNGRFQAEPADRVTVRELVQRHYETCGRQRATTSEQAHAHAKILIERLGHLRLDELNRREQVRFVDGLRARPYSPSYISDVLSALRQAVKRAVDLEELAAPIRVISVKRERQRVAPILSVQQLSAFWAAAERSFHASMYAVLALGTAGRPAAILDLTRDRVREDLRTVQLLPHGREQTHKRRPTVPLTEPVKMWARLVPEGFLVHVDGHPLQRVRSTFAGIRTRAGLPAAVSPYSLRRSVATHLKRLGVPVDDIAALLGHSAGNPTTELYAEVGDFLPRAKEGIEELFNEIGRAGARPIVPTVAANPPRQRRCP